MANPITSGIENVLGLDTTAGTAQLQQALAALQAVGVPTAQQLDLPTLQKYVSAGVLTPQQYQAIQENPNVYSQMIQQTQSNTGMNAQQAALQQLGGIVQAGGSTPINQANLVNNINTTNQAMQAARQGIQENAQERGVAGGGQEFLNQLLNEQGNAQTANMGAVNAASNNAQLALAALANEGTLGGQVQNESQQSAQAQAQAAQQIAQYNSQLQSAANQYNTQNANQAQAANLANAQAISGANTGLQNQQTEYNAQVPQTIYNDTLNKAQAEAGAYSNQANLAEQQAQGQNQFIGGLLGDAAKLGAAYYTGGASLAANGDPAMSGTQAINSGYGSTPTGANANPTNYGINQQPVYAQGGEVRKPMDLHLKKGALHKELGVSQDKNIPAKKIEKATHSSNELLRKRAQFAENAKHWQHKCQGGACYCQGGECYAQGGETHDHAICMKIGGNVPGTPQVPGDNTKNDTVPAMLSPHEIVLPRTIAQAPNAPQAAAQFVQGVKQNGGNPPQGPQMQPQGNGKSFADIIKELEANGLELRLGTL